MNSVSRRRNCLCKWYEQLPNIIVSLVAIICVAIYYWMPYSGDDLIYMGCFKGLNGGVNGGYDAVFDIFPRFQVKHWLTSNGRFANEIFPILGVWFPKWVNALVAGLSIGWMMWATLKLTQLEHQAVLAKIGVLTVIVFAFPWWDSFMLFDVIQNYVVSTALILTFLWLVFYYNQWIHSKQRAIIIGLIAFLAGGMHEAASIPIVVSTVLYLIWVKYSSGISWTQIFPGRVRVIILLFAVSSILCFSSPGIWHRFGLSGNNPDDSVGLILIKSDAIPLLLYGIILIGCISKKFRERIAALVFTPWFIVVVASFGSFLFSAVSGIVGRSGWFSSIYALVAMVQLFRPEFESLVQHKMAIIFSFVLSILIVAHYSEVFVWQLRVGNEAVEVYEKYAKAPDGVVYFNVTSDDEVPWYVLGKTRGVPDADDLHQLFALQYYYKKGIQEFDTTVSLKIIPTDIDYSTVDRVADLVELPAGFITGTRPKADYVAAERRGAVEIVNVRGREYCIVPFVRDDKPYWYLSPRVIDPGDRYIVTD